MQVNKNASPTLYCDAQGELQVYDGSITHGMGLGPVPNVPLPPPLPAGGAWIPHIGNWEDLEQRLLEPGLRNLNFSRVAWFLCGEAEAMTSARDAHVAASVHRQQQAAKCFQLLIEAPADLAPLRIDQLVGEFLDGQHESPNRSLASKCCTQWVGSVHLWQNHSGAPVLLEATSWLFGDSAIVPDAGMVVGMARNLWPVVPTYPHLAADVFAAIARRMSAMPKGDLFFTGEGVSRATNVLPTLPDGQQRRAFVDALARHMLATSRADIGLEGMHVAFILANLWGMEESPELSNFRSALAHCIDLQGEVPATFGKLLSCAAYISQMPQSEARPLVDVVCKRFNVSDWTCGPAFTVVAGNLLVELRAFLDLQTVREKLDVVYGKYLASDAQHAMQDVDRECLRLAQRGHTFREVRSEPAWVAFDVSDCRKGTLHWRINVHGYTHAHARALLFEALGPRNQACHGPVRIAHGKGEATRNEGLMREAVHSALSDPRLKHIEVFNPHLGYVWVVKPAWDGFITRLSEDHFGKALLDKARELCCAEISFPKALAQLCIDAGIVSRTNDTLRGVTPLHLAVRDDDVAAMRMLFRAGARIDAKDLGGRTPLHWACEQGHVQAVRLLMEYHADASILDDNGESPLNVAISNGHEQTLRPLLQSTGRG